MQNKTRIFIEPVFKGERFADSSLPHELLPDLESYFKIIIAVAKELYRQEHPEKIRLPKGFEERFKVGLAGLQAGSAMTVFSREYEESGWENDEFDRARDIVSQQLLNLAQEDHVLGLSEKILPLFKSFGEHLRPDESIELRIPGIEHTATYSIKVRSTILAINQKPYQDVCYISGAIVGFNAENGVFNLVLNDSTQISGPLDGSFDLQLREIAAKYNKKKKEDISVTVVGIAQYKADHSIEKIETLQHITIVKEGIPIFLPDPFKRIDEFAEMENGWFEEGKGKKFDQDDLQRIKNWLSNLLQTADIPAPFIYPSPDHLLVTEWSFGFWEIIFEFDQESILLHATNTSGEETREDKIPLDIDSMSRATRFLQNLLTSSQS